MKASNGLRYFCQTFPLLGAKTCLYYKVIPHSQHVKHHLSFLWIYFFLLFLLFYCSFCFLSLFSHFVFPPLILYLGSVGGFRLLSLVAGALVCFSALIAFQQAGQWLALHSTTLGVFQERDAGIRLCRNLQSQRRTSKASLRLGVHDSSPARFRFGRLLNFRNGHWEIS